MTAERMAVALTHRGPDDAGAAWFPDERVAFGFRRLEVLDLTAAAAQPMSTEEGQYCLVFNGEIYNHHELRRDLEGRGCRFFSRGDTEALLRLYALEGPRCVLRLNGMFAFALLDRPRGRLVLARDRLGIKPLYYHRGDGRLLFASEIKAIIASGGYAPDLDWQALADYLTYLHIPGPQTMFAGIQQVPPAHVIEIDLASLATSSWRYWDAADALEGRSDPEGLRDLLADAVRLQMEADVPVGVFLSGGVDSPLLAGLMAEAASRPVKTFTVVFRGAGSSAFDESGPARVVAERIGSEHHEIEVPLDPEAMLDLVGAFDQPFGNPTAYLSYLVSRATREAGATVALSGSGGDELFGGYPRYRAAVLARRLRRVPASAMRALARPLDLLRDDFEGTGLRRLRTLCEGWDDDFPRAYTNWTYFTGESRKRRLLGPALSARAGSLPPADRWLRRRLGGPEPPTDGNRLLLTDLETFLPDNVLEYTDRTSMAVGLEARVPYLDHRLVEYALGLPFERKVRHGHGKLVLKEAFPDLLPPALAAAPKRGFNAPIARWMRDDLDHRFDPSGGPLAVERMGILDGDAIRALRAEHRTGKRDNGHELFGILALDAWFRRYLLGEAEAGGDARARVDR